MCPLLWPQITSHTCGLIFLKKGLDRCWIGAASALGARRNPLASWLLCHHQQQLCCQKTLLTPPREDKRPSRGSGTRPAKRPVHSRGDRSHFKLYFPASSRRDDDGPSFKAQPNLHAKIRRQRASVNPAFHRTLLVDPRGSIVRSLIYVFPIG